MKPAPSPRLVLALSAALLLGACQSDGEPKLSKEQREQQIAVHAQSAAMYLNMGEYERAMDQAQRGLNLDPEHRGLRLYLGRSLQKIGGTDQILAAEKVYRSMEPEGDFRVPLGLAEVLERKGVAYDEAADGVEDGRRYTEAADPAARAVELRADAQAAWEESLARYEEALELQPGDLEVLAGLARVNSLLERYDQSLRWAQALIDTAGTDREFWQAQLERPNITASDQAGFQASLRRLEDMIVAARKKAETLYRELGRPAEALAQLDALLEIDPRQPDIHARRAQVLAELGRHREAIAAADRFLEQCGLPFDHPDVQKAFRLRNAWRRAADEEATTASPTADETAVRD